MTLAYPLTDGFALSFDKAEIDVAGRIFTAISSVSFNQPIEEGIIRGTSAYPLSRTRGQADIGEGALEFSDVEEYAEFRKHVAGLSGANGAFCEGIWELSVTYRKNEDKVITAVCKSCRALDSEFDHEEGPDGLPVSVPFSFMRRLIDGIPDLAE
jgi:hypothetical protein